MRPKPSHFYTKTEINIDSLLQYNKSGSQNHNAAFIYWATRVDSGGQEIMWNPSYYTKYTIDLKIRLTSMLTTSPIWSVMSQVLHCVSLWFWALLSDVLDLNTQKSLKVDFIVTVYRETFSFLASESIFLIVLIHSHNYNDIFMKMWPCSNLNMQDFITQQNIHFIHCMEMGSSISATHFEMFHWASHSYWMN
jgi:hypothetical protein